MTNLTKMPVLNWHKQNPNITTVELLKVLLQSLHSKALESEFNHPNSNAYVTVSVAW